MAIEDDDKPRKKVSHEIGQDLSLLSIEELGARIADGLLSFPVTDFGADGEFDAASYAKRLQWLSSYGAAGLFAAGGTGEFFSIGYDEYDAVIRTAVENSAADHARVGRVVTRAARGQRDVVERVSISARAVGDGEHADAFIFRLRAKSSQ